MSADNNLILQAVKEIKTAILQSRYIAARQANAEQLKLYFAVGGYVSANTRGKDKWGTGAIEQISSLLSRELPGLKGFSASNIKYMRIFFEQWQDFVYSQLYLEQCKNLLASIEQSIDIEQNKNRQTLSDDLQKAFLSVGFSHHIDIVIKCKTLEERLYYIQECASHFWSYRTLQQHLKADDYKHIGKMPNNFALTMPDSKQVSRAVMAFKDEMLLDFINIEEEQDPECIDERVLEQSIIQNIRKFIQCMGTDFCFIDSQHRMVENGDEFYCDLLFFNRTLQCLVAIELKSGKFKPAYLGQLNFYLTLLDKYERRSNENPSVGIVMCKNANKSVVELAVRDYNNPMGVTTYSLAGDIPEAYKVLAPLSKIADILNGSND
ncbi:MAG: PDDEXK nuclease domain-containing protein [Bacteroidales bacterium]|nr:PDDEXK nuclease domain-containing protein [Bacteroidales bacterium]